MAGLLITAIGAGWVFVINGLSFLAVITSLTGMRVDELYRPRHHEGAAAPAVRGGILSGLRYLKTRPDLLIALAMLFLLSTYGLNFPIFISTMAVTTFHGGAHTYGALSSMMAIGSILGALHVAGRSHPSLTVLIVSAFGFGVVGTLAAIMPHQASFGLMLIGLGIMAQVFNTSTNSLVQLSTHPSMRGRVMAIYMGIFLGCTPLGAPLVGWIADAFGPRWALGVGAASGFVAALVGVVYQARTRNKARPE